MAKREFVFDDGGRAAAGFKGIAGDCVARSIAIASGKPYAEVYKALAQGMKEQRVTKRTAKSSARKASARNGVYTRRKWFREYMESLGATWTPTMRVGSGCKVHLCAEELPKGRLVVAVSKHYTAIIDGVIHDTFDPRRESGTAHIIIGPDDKPNPRWKFLRTLENGRLAYTEEVGGRCVYGYWTLPA